MIFFRGSLPIQKYLPDGNFRKCLPTNCLITCLLNKSPVSLCEVSKTLRILKKAMPFKLNVVFT